MQEYKKDIGSKSQAEVNTTQMWFAYLQKVIFFRFCLCIYFEYLMPCG